MTPSEGHQAAPSVDEERGAAKPRVIPNNQLVILRESELDCDLPTAIQRVREDESTTGSRILIVGPDEEAGRSADATLPLPQLPMSIGQVARSGGGSALTAAGARIAAKIDSLDCLMSEARHALHTLEESSADKMSASSASGVRVVGEVLGWIQANVEDLGHEIEGLQRGFQIVDLGELIREVQGQAESFFPKLRVNSGACIDGDCWGHAAALTEALFLAIVVAAHRIAGTGSVNIEVGAAGEDLVEVRLLGFGEPAEVQAPQQMSRLREIVVEQHGGRILPGSLGPFGTGLILELRRRP